MQHSTEPKITLENKRKCEISKQSARIKVREISEHCWRKATNWVKKEGPSNGHLITKIYRLAEHVNTLEYKVSN